MRFEALLNLYVNLFYGARSFGARIEGTGCFYFSGLTTVHDELQMGIKTGMVNIINISGFCEGEARTAETRLVLGLGKCYMSIVVYGKEVPGLTVPLFSPGFAYLFLIFFF